VQGNCCVRLLSSAPVGGGNPLPDAEGADEGIRILIAEKIGGFVQLKHRIGKVMAGQLVTGLLQHLLETRACVLQVTLQGSRTDVEVASNILHFWSAPGELLLDGGADPLGKSLLTLVLLQFCIDLRCEHR
jgi:hypothetical protein